MNLIQQILSFCRFAWIPFLLVVVLVLLVSIPHRRYRKFFRSIDFFDYRGILPRYIRSTRVSQYLTKTQFKSRIPIERWRKILPDLEQFQNHRVYLAEQLSNHIRTTNIFFIQEELPSFIRWQDSLLSEKENVFLVGEGYRGKVTWDVSILPHGIVAGASGGGKTALLRCIVHQAIMKKYNVNVMDFKCGGDFVAFESEIKKYKNLDDDYGPFLITDPEEANKLLICLTVEVRGRMQVFKECGVTNIYEYNNLGKGHFVPWLIVIDEAAELFDVKDKALRGLYEEINHSLRILARTSRVAGVHLIMGIIRPDSNILDGQIKNNLLWRVCGYFADSPASRIVLDNDKATELPPEIKGRFIIGEEETQAYYLPPEPPAPAVRS